MGLGFIQFGFVAIYLSESFIRGFMTAAGLQILISVLKYIFGMTIPSYTGPGAIILVSLGTYPTNGASLEQTWEQSSLLWEAVSCSF
jgi:MFS superfamily sulfate permease-like transporter